MIPTLWGRLGSAFAVHPHGETPVSTLVAADLAERTRRRARIIAWVGFLSAFPLFYLDHWFQYQQGGWQEDPALFVGFLTWRVVSVTTLGAYLVWDRRAPRGLAGDRKLASAFTLLAILQAAGFGIWFEADPQVFAQYIFLLLFIAVLLQPPSLWAGGTRLRCLS